MQIQVERKSVCSPCQGYFLEFMHCMMSIMYSYTCTPDQYSFSYLFSMLSFSSPPPSLPSSSRLLFLFLFWSVGPSGTKGLRVCGPHGSPGRRGRDSGSRLHSGARSPRRGGLLGDGAAREKRDANPGRAQRHQHHTRALHVAAAELRAGEDADLCGASPSPANRVPHSLYTKCPVWVTT